MKLAAIAFSLAVSAFACASGVRDTWEVQEQNFATPGLEEALSGEGVAHNSEQYGKCIKDATDAAMKAAEFQCRGVEAAQRSMCERGQYEKQFNQTEKGCRATDSDRGSSIKAGGNVGGHGGSVEYKSK